MLRFNWGEQRLHSAVLRDDEARGGFSVGSAKGVDFTCGDVQGAERFFLVPPGQPGTVRFVRGMQGTLWHGDEALTLKEAIARGDATEDGDGYAVALGKKDAVQLEVGGLSFEALLVRVPERVAAEPLEQLDLRMLNVFGAVAVCAMIAIAAAVADEGDAAFNDDSVPATKSLAHFVAQPPPPKHERVPAASQQPTKQEAAIAREGRPAPKNAKIGKPPPGQVAQQLAQAFHGLTAGLPDVELSNAIGAIRANATVSSVGFGGIGLKDTGTGGPCDNCTVRIGAIGTHDHGKGHDPFGPGSKLLGDKEKPDPTLTTTDVVVIGLDKELIRQVIHRHRQEVRFCYDLALTSNPSLRGKTAVKFVIGPSGTVAAANVTESSVHELDDCLRSRVSQWVFPKPPGGGTAIVTYPFVFNRS